MKKEFKQRRIFSESFKRKLVSEIENCDLSVKEVSRIYKVSTVSVYRWLSKYSVIYQRKGVIVLEEKSEGKKRKLLEEQVKELQRAPIPELSYWSRRFLPYWGFNCEAFHLESYLTAYYLVPALMRILMILMLYH